MANLRRERGQVILIAAFAMAVTFIALALVVNSAIFTENLASRGETSGSDDALVVRHEVAQSVGEGITYANTYNTSSEGKQAANVSESVADISDSITEQQAATGKLVTIEGPTAFNNGTRIRDNASGGGSNFTNQTGAANWTVAENVDNTRAFRMNISDWTNSNFQGSRHDEFRLNVTDGSSTQRINITNGSSGKLTVGVKEQGGDEGICEVTGSPDYVRIDLTRGLVGGEPCPYLDFGAGVGTPYDITFNNSDLITGNYSVVIGNNGHTGGNNDYSSLSSRPDPDDPFATNAIYSANVTYRYDGPDITYNTTVRVAPGEPR